MNIYRLSDSSKTIEYGMNDLRLLDAGNDP